MMEAVLQVAGMRSWITDIAYKHCQSIRIIDCVPWQKDGGQALFEIDIPPRLGKEIVEDILAHPEVFSMEIETLAEKRISGSIALRNCGMIRMVLGAGCFMESARALDNGVMEFHIACGTEGSFHQLVKTIEDKGMKVDIKRLSAAVPRESATRKQEELIRLALEKGYFDYPRRINVKRLSGMCHVAPSTLAEILKRGEKNILSDYFRLRE
ncbi:MAG: helix-turn-helix domain-containing protein [Methanomassiliicoccales archaeon]|nr:helix-turn-helix domain-containing protein [Methanomassiliicoccales archaeon]